MGFVKYWDEDFETYTHTQLLHTFVLEIYITQRIHRSINEIIKITLFSAFLHTYPYKHLIFKKLIQRHVQWLIAIFNSDLIPMTLIYWTMYLRVWSNNQVSQYRLRKWFARGFKLAVFLKSLHMLKNLPPVLAMNYPNKIFKKVNCEVIYRNCNMYFFFGDTILE